MSVQGPGQYTDEQTTQQHYAGGQPQQQHFGAQRATESYGGGRGGASGFGRSGRKPFFLTSEFLVLLATIAALVIAAAVSDEFDARRVWTLVTVLSAAYIVSRGLSKIGHHHDDGFGGRH